jgi:phospholipid/cholesterol/gamma-HCH transport system permease protein
MADEMPQLETAAPGRLKAAGDWLLDDAARLSRTIDRVSGPVVEVDASGISRLDAAGALLLLKLLARFDLPSDVLALRPEHAALISAVAAADHREPPPSGHAPPTWRALLERIGQTVVGLGRQMTALLGFLGLTLVTLSRLARDPRRLRLTATVHHMEQTGFDAVPLVALLSFLVGAVVAFLGATVLRDFGADLFVVELVSFAFLREFGVLLTAILLAGRTASAFTAQIGTMKSREEIDAIRTLGLDPIELLVIPRLIALVIMLPLLSVIAAMAGMLGGMLVAIFDIGMTADLFINRLHDTLQLRHYLVGLSKAPIFAVVIALVGCLEGFKVAGTAQSVGERTTSAVVQSISLVIVIDAIAAVFFMEMGW